MLQKCDSSFTALNFDACPHCGFIYGTRVKEGCGVTEFDAESSKDVWLSILAHHDVRSAEELIAMYADFETGPDVDDFFPSVFDYSGDSQEEIQGRITDLQTLEVH